MKFAKNLISESIPEWRTKYMDYKQMKKVMKQVTADSEIEQKDEVIHFFGSDGGGGGGISPEEDPSKSLFDSFLQVAQSLNIPLDQTSNGIEELVKVSVGKGHEKFFLVLNGELMKVNSFYLEREQEAKLLLSNLKEQVSIYLQIRHQGSPTTSNGETGNQQRKEARAFKKLKGGILEFYRYLTLIQNYRILNYTGFVKALKKFDKLAGWKSSPMYLDQKELFVFHYSDEIPKLMDDSEELYMDFYDGKLKRSQARQALRIGDQVMENVVGNDVPFRIGLYLAFGLSLMVPTITQLVHEETASILTDSTAQLIQIYAGFSIPIFFSMLFAWNLYGWTEAQVNYKFIFELDQRDNIAYIQFFELGTFLFLMWSLFTHMTFCDPFHGADAWFKPYYPLLFGIYILVILFVPLPFFYYTSRRWFSQTLFRMAVTPYYRVEFRDFFMADEFCSMIYFLSSLQLFVCFYYNQGVQTGVCHINQSFVSPLINMIPGYIRLMQCFRRYYDSKNVHPHITNAGKYAFVIMICWTSAWYSISRTKLALVFWVISLIISTIYSYSWDVLFDWGFFQKGSKNKYLRNVLFYERKWVYYWAIVSNFFLRLSWALLVSVGFWGKTMDSRAIVYLVALLEIFRRFQWNFFRLENEHTNNCGQYRVIKEIPMPYAHSAGDYVGEVHRNTRQGSTFASGELFKKLINPFSRQNSNGNVHSPAAGDDTNHLTIDTNHLTVLSGASSRSPPSSNRRSSTSSS